MSEGRRGWGWQRLRSFYWGEAGLWLLFLVFGLVRIS
jgi:hypothetical protein